MDSIFADILHDGHGEWQIAKFMPWDFHFGGLIKLAGSNHWYFVRQIRSTTPNIRGHNFTRVRPNDGIHLSRVLPNLACTRRVQCDWRIRHLPTW